MEKNDPGQVPDTGHEWDGIRELTNPPPRWWMISLYASGLFVVVYLILYPSIPLIHGSNKGLLGWTMITEFKEAVAENDAIKAPFLKKVAAMSPKELLADGKMRNFAESAAKAAFGDNCAACHGSGGQGAPGLFPVLADDDWLYGGSMDVIIETITEGRQGNMPAHADMLDDAEINRLADFVLAVSKGKATQEGFTLFDDSGCSACHGTDAKGSANHPETADGEGIDHSVGSANLTDQIWRFGGSRDEILRTIRHGVNQEDEKDTRTAIMPVFGEKLSPEMIKMLAVKVHGFGGGV